MANLNELIAEVSASSPQGCGLVPLVPGRILLADGDGLAYYCAGNDDTTTGEARANLIDKLKAAQRICGAEQVRILLTASGSHKGHRYAIARVKPYQGQRTNSRRPKNWQALRDFMESGSVAGFQVESTAVAEADDLFGKYAYLKPKSVVLYTQDKDMRMLPGMHLDWVAHTIHTVVADAWRGNYQFWSAENSEAGGKQYGPKWFWQQMLQGDQADNIPGLPKYKALDAKGKEAFKPMGEVTACRMLEGMDKDHTSTVAALYCGYYGNRWLVELMEQACLLWMRRDPEAWDDCLNPGGPLERYNDGSELFAAAYHEIQQRVRDADHYNHQAQDNTGSEPALSASS